MTADVHDVVHAAEHPIIAVAVAARGIAREICAGNAAPVLLLEALGIAPNGSDHARPRSPDDKKSFLVRADFVPVEIHDIGNDSRKRQRSRSGLLRYSAGHWCDHR